MTDDDGEEPSMTIAATPDDGTRRRERRIYLKQRLDVVNSLVVRVNIGLVVVHVPCIRSKSTHARLFILHVLKVITANHT